MSGIIVAAPTFIRAWVDIGEGEESAEGHWYAPSAELLKFEPMSDPVVCPFCFGPLERIKVASIFGRIVKDEEKHYGGKTSVVVELMPPTHEALSCSNCDIVYTSLKDQP